MTFFKKEDFVSKYTQYSDFNEDWKIEAVCEMIYSQVGLKYRNPSWNENTCPTAIKNASMEQLRFMLEYDIPFIDYKGTVTAGDMSSELKTDYSTLSLRYLANAGYLYRGNTLNQNMSLNMPFGSN